MIKDWTSVEREIMRIEVPKTALHTPFRDGTVLDLVRQILPISIEGLRRRGRKDVNSGNDEVQYLSALEEIAASGRAPAEDLLDAYRGRWNGSVDPVFEEYAY
jgi:glutamate--cysteine ligase